MKKIIFNTLFCFITINIAHADIDLSYAELGKKLTTKSYKEIEGLLKDMNKKTLPPQVKMPRKRVLHLKILLDLFVYAYPKSKKNSDLWKDYRNIVDEGYEIMGNFKDIRDGQLATGLEEDEIDYDTKEVNSKRKVLLGWVEEYFDFITEYKIEDYLNDVDVKKDKRYERKKKDLPKFLWGKDKSLRPNKDLTGLENLRLLVSELYFIASEELEELTDLKSILDKEDEEKFHDFRKSLRTLNKILLNIPYVDHKYITYGNDFKHISLAVSMCGDINDKFIALHKKEKKQEVKALKKEIKAMWEEAKDWIVSVNLMASLQKVSLDLVN